jgi:hypothetical protein
MDMLCLGSTNPPAIYICLMPEILHLDSLEQEPLNYVNCKKPQDDNSSLTEAILTESMAVCQGLL